MKAEPKNGAGDLKQDGTWVANRGNTLENTLRAELDYIEAGVYVGIKRTPQMPSPVFRMSPTCINFGSPRELRSCEDCKLITFVPQDRRRESRPCHFIPLDEKGTTVHELAFQSQREVEWALTAWIKKELEHLEKN